MIAATVTQPGDAVPEAARIRLRFTSATKPAVITPSSVTGGDFRYLVVPQRLV